MTFTRSNNLLVIRILIPRLKYVDPYLSRLLPQTQYFEQSAQIRTYDAEVAFELLNSHYRSLRLTILLRFGGKAPLNWVRGLSLS